MEKVAFSFSIIGSAVGVVFFVAPILMIVKLCKTKNAKEVSEYIFIANCLNSTSWIVNFSRIFPTDYPPLMIHVLGISCNYVYYVIFCVYKYQKLKRYLLIPLS